MSDLPAGWEWSTLGEIVDFLDHLRRPVNAAERRSRHGAVPYYGATGQVGWIDEKLFDEDLVLLGEDGVQFFEQSRQKAYLISGPAWVNNHAHVLRCVAGIDRRFVAHYLNIVDYRRAATGTTRLKLTKSAANQIRIPVPPAVEQRRIVSALDYQLSRLDAGRRSSVSAQSRRDDLIAALRTSEINAATAPDGSLTDVLDSIQAGRSFGGSARPAGTDEWGIIKVSAMTWGEFRQSENKAVADSARIERRFEIHPGDVLVSRANTIDYVGAAVLVRDTRPRLLLSDKSLRLRPRHGVDPRWLVEVLSAPSVRQQIAARSTGNQESMRNISQAALLSVRIPIHNADQQLRIADTLAEHWSVIDRLMADLRTTERSAADLRRSLLTEAFAGRLVPQDPDDEPAAVLLDRIRTERAAQPTTRRTRKPVR